MPPFSASITVSTPALVAISCLSGFIFGFDLGVVPGAMMFVRVDFELNHLWQQILVSSSLAAAAFASALALGIVGVMGRRNTLILAAVLFQFGATLLALSPTFSLLLAGRTVQGLAIGLSSTSAPGLIADYCVHSARGVLLSLYPFSIVTGQFAAGLAAALVGQFGWSWRFLFGSVFIPSCALCLICIFCVRHTSLPKHSVIFAPSSQTNSSSWTTFWHTASVRRLLLIGCTLHAVQQFAGVNTIMYYCATIIEASGVSNPVTALWLVCIPMGLYVVVMLAVIPLVDRCQFRAMVVHIVRAPKSPVAPVVIESNSNLIHYVFTMSVLISLLCISAGFAISHIMVVCAITVYIMCFAVGLAGLPWTITAELYPTDSKTQCAAIVTTVNWTSNLVVSLTFLTLFDTLGHSGTYLLYAAFTVIGILVILFALPETKGQDPETLHSTVSAVPLLRMGQSASRESEDSAVVA